MINLIKNMSVIIVLAYVLSRTETYSDIVKKNKIDRVQKLYFAFIFGFFSIYGTLSGINFNGAIANIRDLGPAIGGLMAGPWVGVAAGIIGGLHRYILGGITALPCSISTVLAGLAGGVIYRIKKGDFISVRGAIVFMAFFEAFHMGLNLLMIRPFDEIFVIIKNVSVPMIATNSIGLGIFAFIIHNLVREKETMRQKELIESELTIAREIQMSMVPKLFPAFPEQPEFDIFAVLEPAKEVGGDLYDFFLLDEDHLCFTIGDVSGKGVPASLFMAVTKTLIKAKAVAGVNSDQILDAVNYELCKDNDSGMFVTEFLGIMKISTGEVSYSNGGHNLPYLLHSDGSLDMLPKMPGMALGVMEDVPYSSAKVTLKKGDSLVMYTDGVTEAMNKSGDLFTEERLEDALKGRRGLSVKEEVDILLSSTKEFVDKAVQSDDITILILKYKEEG